MINDASLLVSRIALAGLFVYSGFGMATGGVEGFAGFMGAIGLPFPALVAWAVLAVKLGGGLMLVAGLGTRVAALAIAAFCIGAAILGHADFSDQGEVNQFLKNVAIAGGLLALATAGPGSWSVDAKLKRR